MQLITEKELIELWHSGEPATKIVERLDIMLTPKQLIGQWQQLKSEGKLPPIERPASRHFPRGQATEHHDGRPRVSAITAAGTDPLLERLEQAHELHDDGTVTERS